MIVILGGTAAYHLNLEEFGTPGEAIELDTPYGRAAPLIPLAVPGIPPLLFTSRHGQGHLARSAAFVNHRANLWAMHAVGATGVISWNGVGAIAPEVAVGQMVVPDDLLDRSRARQYDFDGPRAPMPGEHLFAPPFDATLRGALAEAARALGERLLFGGLYVATEGPRLESAAEIEAAAREGATVVGMTLSPEVWLARALDLPFASLAVVTNRATGTAWREERRDFSPSVGARALRVALEAVRRLEGDESQFPTKGV